MGRVTITPTYTDYSNGFAWSTLGSNQAAVKAVVQRVCDVCSAALSTPPSVGDIAFYIDFGLSARGPGGQPGLNIGDGGANSAPPGYNVYTFAQIRNALLALPGICPFQQSVWSPPNLPASRPAGLTDPFAIYPSLEWALGLATWTQNQTLGYVGLGISSSNDTDINGLGSGANWFTIIFHEVGEMLARLDAITLWCFTSAGTHFYPNPGNTTACYLSFDNGVTSQVAFNATGSGDVTDLNSPGDAFHAYVQSGPCSRSASLPGRANNWLMLATIGWILTPTGLTYAELPQLVVPGNVGIIGMTQ